MTLETYYVGVRVNALEDALETPVDERVGTIEVQTVILDKSGIRFSDKSYIPVRGYLEIKCLYFRRFAFCLDNGSRWCFRWERAAVTATQYSPT